MSTRTMIFIAVLVFAVSLGVVTGNRLSADALPIALGVAVGVTAGIPISLVLAAVMTRQTLLTVPAQQGRPSGTGNGANGKHAAPNGNGRSVRAQPVSAQKTYVPAPIPTGERRFTVVGGASAPLLEEDDLFAIE